MTILALLFLKHFICDYPLQAHPYIHQNKGTYGHPGGLIHAYLHGVGTALATGSWWAAVADFVLHYHIDWAKNNINRVFSLRPDGSAWFWVLMGFDQLLHSITYLGIVRWLDP